MDLDKGFDPDSTKREIASLQTSQIADHKHNIEHAHAAGTLRAAGGEAVGTGEMVFKLGNGELIRGLNLNIWPNTAKNNVIDSMVGAIELMGTTAASSTNVSGGVESVKGETRPINIAINYIIKVK